MTTHPITPPHELMVQWMDELWPNRVWHKDPEALLDRVHAHHLTTQAACWGADQELEACVKLLSDLGGDGDRLRGALAQPESEGPTDEELLETVRHLYGDQRNA